VRTGGDARNREYVAGHLDSTAPPALEALCLDPQTSGGLLAAVEPDVAPELVAAGFWSVGTIEPGEPHVVLR
jgi:selenophosphate synthase